MMRRSWSLRRRLIVGLSVVLVLGAALPVIAVIIGSSQSINTMLDRALQDQAADIVRVFDAKAKTLAVPETLARAYTDSANGFLYAVYDRDGNALFSSSPRAAEVLKQVMGYSEENFFALNPVSGGGPWYAYKELVDGNTIAVAQSGLHEDVLADSVAGELARESTPILLVVMAIGIAVIWITLRQAFREVDKAAAIAEAMQPGQGAPQLGTNDMPVEIRPFVDAVGSAMLRLENALDAERRFIANAAHEIRTPLSILTARIDRLPPDANRAVLSADANRLNRLVAQLLDAARLDANTIKADRVFDLREVLVNAVAEIAPLAVKEGREIAVGGDTAPLMVRGDPHAIALGVRNLIENALTHTPGGTPIEVDLAQPAKILVKDRGGGIPSADRERLFDRFQRGATKGSGTGLGLAIVHEIMRQHEGSVEIEDRDGGGSVFVLSLPAERVIKA
jgi:signal transduction histidine kinase